MSSEFSPPEAQKVEEKPRRAPQPLPYHECVRDHLREREPELWKWFVARETPEALRENVRLDLLKSAVRLERGDRAELYRTADEVAECFGLEVPITLYQAQSGEAMNAGLYFVPGEIHVVLQGPVLERLSAEELRALIGHELTHYVFLTDGGGEFHTTVSILDSLCQGSNVEFAHVVTARNFDLYTEILCDRGASIACGEPLVAIATLVKVGTGLKDVNPESYVRQAEEIVAKGAVQSEGVTHPETYVRSRALTLFADRGADAEAEIAAMIEGGRKLDELDLHGQGRVSALTRRLIQAFLANEALRGKAQIAQAHLYFDDFALPPEAEDWPELAAALACKDPGLRDFYCYVLLDFVAVDRDVTDAALVAGLRMFAELGWDDRLAELSGKELGVRKREMDKLRKQAAAAPAAGGDRA